MKRGSNSRVSNSNSKRRRNRNRNISQKQVYYSGPSFSDLPKDILENIFTRLFIKSIFVCKSVCKAWHDLLSDPEFARLYFDESCDQAYPLIHTMEYKSQSGNLYLVQPVKDDMELKLGMCEHRYFKPGCVCNVKFALDTKFDLPSGNNIIANSCNGLLCLSLPARKGIVIICNPVTGEYINLPEDEKDKLWDDVRYGFGLSPLANQYKVVKFPHYTGYARVGYARVHTVGTKSWRDISSKPGKIIDRCSVTTYFKGYLYWFSHLNPPTLYCFDVENECFGSDSGPEIGNLFSYLSIHVGVLGRELCMSVFTKCGTLHIWATKGSGVEMAWSKVISIDMHMHGKRTHYSLPMKYLSDGSLLMFSHAGKALVYADPKKGKLRFLRVKGKKSHVLQTLVAHIPSLISLKHYLSGYNVKVLNLRRRGEVLKSHGQTKYLYIGEEEFPPF